MFYQKFFSRQLFAAAFLLFVSLPVTAQVRNHLTGVENQAENNSAAAIVNRAVKLDSEGKYAKAVEEYKRALLLKPKNVVIYNNLGVAYAKQQLFTKALDVLKKAIIIDPNSATAYFNLSIVYDYQNRLQDALVKVRRSLEINSKNVKAFTLSCELKLVLKQDKEAVNCYESLRKIAPLNEKSQAFYGLSLLRAKKINQAIAVLEESVRISPNSLLSHNLLGTALHKKKRYKNAVEVFRRALEIDPENAEIRFNLAQTQLKAGNKAAALVHYKIIKEKNPVLARKLYKSLYSDKVIFVENK